MIRYITPFVILFIGSIALSQTPEQYYFDWTSLPFSKEELSMRREKLMKQLPNEGIIVMPSKDGFSNGETFRQLDNFYYFTGLELPNSLLVLNLNTKSAAIYAPERDLRFESTSRPNDFPGRPIIKDSTISQNSGLIINNIKDFSKVIDAAAENGTTIFMDAEKKGSLEFPKMDYIATLSPVNILFQVLRQKQSGLRFENLYEAVAKVRMVKSKAEIEVMRKVTAINVAGIKTAAKSIRAGVDERYLEGILEGNYKVNGAHRLAFGSIIKSGPNSLWPWRILATHYNRRNRVMENGDLVIFDVGCEYQQYVSDVGRTFPVSGKFTEKQKEILTMEVGIADQIIDFIKPGITFADIKKLTDSILPENAKKYMQVGLYFGHHLGLSTGDPDLSEAKLEPGMIFTVEPWYYNHEDQISVFTEDVILVTEDGCDVLSYALPRTPEGLEKMMKD
ncbi:MAG: Xaa-Pro peptidase family protein [Flavobacteriaceae bacterium]